MDEKIIQQDVVDISEKVFESDYFIETDQWITFLIGDKEHTITFDLTVDASVYQSDYDYFSPPDSHFIIHHQSIDIKEVMIGEDVVETTDEDIEYYTKLIELNL